MIIGIVDRPSRTLTVLSGAGSTDGARIVVRDSGRTIGYVELSGTDHIVDRAVAACPAATPQREWVRGSGAELTASIVISTLGKTPLLVDAVTAALNQTHRHFDVIVVDNDPDSGDTQRLLSDLDVTIVAEPTKGLSHARNRGLRAATGEIVAFTDDDAITDPHWLAEILDVFASLPVAGVTGPVFPKELQTPSQRYFEARGGFPQHLEPIMWDLTTPMSVGGPLYPVTTARVGAGVNMAFRREILTTFDTNLGAGTFTNGGEDLDAFARVLAAGLSIAYTPDAIVHHVHRRDMAGLKKQIYGNGTGMSALLLKTVFHKPRTVAALLKRVPQVLARVAPSSERMAGEAPRLLTWLEIGGFVLGPALYLRQRWLRS